MPSPLFGKFGGNQNRAGFNFGNPQMNQQFEAFARGLDEKVRNSPMQTVQQLINSGKMTQAQFDQLRQLANRLTGKNY